MGCFDNAHWRERQSSGTPLAWRTVSLGSTHVEGRVGLVTVRIYLIPIMKLLEGRSVLFNDALNTFYLRLYGVGHMVKDHSDSERGNPLQKKTVGVLLHEVSICFTTHSAHFVNGYNIGGRILILLGTLPTLN